MSRFIKVDAKGKQLAAGAKKWVAVIDSATGLMFTADDVGDARNHADAEAAVAALTLAGFSDWRLPTVEELFALADRTRVNPAIDAAFFPSCKSDWYWASSAWAPAPAGGAWIVDFHNGTSYSARRNGKARVRAVRSVSGGGQ